MIQGMCACGKPIKPPTEEEFPLEFLKESNAIEGEYDALSLIDSLQAWDYIRAQDRLTPEVILKTHKILMESRNSISNDEKGAFRKTGVRIGARFGKPFYAVPNLISIWCDDMNDSIKRVKKDDTLAKSIIQEAHIQYEEIHPFIDGNGRTGRIFMNWQRVKIGLPILTIKEADKASYYDWFE